jgi:hypothetical protein
LSVPRRLVVRACCSKLTFCCSSRISFILRCISWFLSADSAAGRAAPAAGAGRRAGDAAGTSVALGDESAWRSLWRIELDEPLSSMSRVL